MVWTAWILLSCKAEDLRIHLPPVGLAALSQEDLERDVWQLSKDTEDTWYFTRMKQMGLSSFPIQNGICVGTKENPRVSIVRKNHVSLNISMAAQISLAKVQHGEREKYSFCVYNTPIEGDDWFLEDLTGMILEIEQTSIRTREVGLDLHYPKLLEHVRKVAEHISLVGD